MKFIVTRDTMCVPDLKKIPTSDAKGNKERPHPNHIPKGHYIELGAGDDIKAIYDTDTRTAQLISTLTMAGCIAPVTKENVERLNAELVIDAKREARARELDKAAAGVGAAVAVAAAAAAA